MKNKTKTSPKVKCSSGNRFKHIRVLTFKEHGNKRRLSI